MDLVCEGCGIGGAEYLMRCSMRLIFSGGKYWGHVFSNLRYWFLVSGSNVASMAWQNVCTRRLLNSLVYSPPIFFTMESSR